MSALNKENQINLIPRDEFSASQAGRILTWFLTTFRIMVILVELVVLAAFLSRFWLDAKNSDLNDEIAQKQALLTVSTKFENDFRLIQKKLQIFSDLTTNNVSSSKLLQDVTTKIPPDVFLTSSSLSPNSITLTGSSPSEKSIAQFIANLSSISDFSSVSLNQVEINEENKNLLNFSLQIATREKG